MKNKKEFIEAEIEIIKFDDEDIILTSTGTSGLNQGSGVTEDENGDDVFGD